MRSMKRRYTRRRRPNTSADSLNRKVRDHWGSDDRHGRKRGDAQLNDIRKLLSSTKQVPVNPAFQFMTLISLFHRWIAAAFRRHLNRLDPTATSSPETSVTGPV
jgi:hypothetical protein